MTQIDDRDIVDGKQPGGANTSGSMLLPLLQTLLASVPQGGRFADYERQSIDYNVLGRTTYEGRRRSFRALREMYILDPSRVLFRALRDLWSEDVTGQPLLAGLVVLARDSSFRATANRVIEARPGEPLSSLDLADAILTAFPSYSRASADKIGRNTGASWAQTGHLVGRTDKVRATVTATPAAVAYAAFLGHVQGLRGQFVLDSMWMDFLDLPPEGRSDAVREASTRGYLEYRVGGNVVEVGFRHLARALPEERNDRS